MPVSKLQAANATDPFSNIIKQAAWWVQEAIYQQICFVWVMLFSNAFSDAAQSLLAAYLALAIKSCSVMFAKSSLVEAQANLTCNTSGHEGR